MAVAKDKCERCGKEYDRDELTFVYVGKGFDAVICEKCRRETDIDTEPITVF